MILHQANPATNASGLKFRASSSLAMLGCRRLLAASVRVCKLPAGGCGGSGYGKAAQLFGIDGGIEGTTEPLYGALASGGE